MKSLSRFVPTLLRGCLVLALGGSALAADPVPAAAATPAPPVRKIIPGQVIVPTEKMRRIWGELVSVDFAKRTGTFRNETTDEIMPFNVLPYAELLHHAAFGDLQDFKIGERAIFRMHENEAGEWTWLTYIQDEMNMMNGHKEYFYVDAIDAEKKELNCTQANFDKSYVREKGITIKTDGETRYWKAGQPAKFSDIAIGDKLRTKTHGIGKGKVRVCWEVFLDDESLLKFQNEQKAVHAKRLLENGAPGYVDKNEGTDLQLTMFQEGGDVVRPLKAGQKISVVPAGGDRKAQGTPVAGTIVSVQPVGVITKVALTLDSPAPGFNAAGLARIWKTP